MERRGGRGGGVERREVERREVERREVEGEEGGVSMGGG